MEMTKSEITNMIDRKNALLRRSYETLNNVRDLATMCKDVEFSELEAANIYIKTVGETLRRLTLYRYETLNESEIALPEAEYADEPDESIIDAFIDDEVTE